MMDYAYRFEPPRPRPLRPLAVAVAVLVGMAVGFLVSRCKIIRRPSAMGVASAPAINIPVVGAGLDLLNDFKLMGSRYRVRMSWPVPRLPGPLRVADGNKSGSSPSAANLKPAASHRGAASSASAPSDKNLLGELLAYAGPPGQILATVLGFGAVVTLQRMQPGGLLDLDPIPAAWSMPSQGLGAAPSFARRHRLNFAGTKHRPHGHEQGASDLHRVTGVVHHSFLVAAKAAGLTYGLAEQVVKALRGDVNFRTLHPGDRFSVVYGRPPKASGKGRRVLAVRMVTGDKTHRAFWFDGKHGDGGYFNRQGQSLRQGMLRAPLHYEYISSPFSYHRMDPVAHVVRPHYGVDYAAPIGTPVKAAANGRVIYRGHDHGGYGNLVVIKSFGDYKTYYAHLHGFAKNVHAGDHVHQGEIIGYVGQSGEATGPHLHFGIRVNGKWVNPRTHPLPHAARLASKERPAFKQRVARLSMALNGVSDVRLARK